MKVGLLIVHGIGSQTVGYSQQFQSALKADNLVVHEVCWQAAIEPQQVALFNNLTNIKLRTLRKLFLSYAGDAIDYQAGTETYNEIHNTINTGLEILSQKLDEDSPLIIFAHSLGTVIVSNFIWDQEEHINYQASRNALHLLEHLQALYTVGSPITAFSLKFKDGGRPIRYSRPWYNIYSPFDIIGYPLKPLNSLYKEKDNLYDLSWIVGGCFTFWNPISHNEYWSSKKVIKHLLQTIKGLMNDEHNRNSHTS